MKDNEGSETTEHLAPEEILGVLQAMSADDKIKVIAVERKFLGGTGRQKGELYREALCDALLGKRRCPRKTPMIAFMI